MSPPGRATLVRRLIKTPKLYWSDTGQEVDLVIEHRDGLLPIEVKASRRPGRRDVRGLEIFRDEYPDLFTGGLLLHDGETVEWLSRGILGVSWHRVV